MFDSSQNIFSDQTGKISLLYLLLRGKNLFFSKYDEGVYVGKENSFYKNLERHQIYENYNICQNERLWKDYQIIMEYLPDDL